MRSRISDTDVPARLRAALDAQVEAGAPSALARLEAPRGELIWTDASGQLSRDESRALRPNDAFRIASTTKNVTAVVVVRLAEGGRLALDEPLGDQLSSDLLHRWGVWKDLPKITPRQLLAHTSGLPNYFGEDSFLELLRTQPERVWRPVELVDHAAENGTPTFHPGEGFSYSDTGFVVAGILVEEVTGRSLDEVYRELVFAPLGMEETWLEGHEQARASEVAHHYTGVLDWTSISPTIDWAGGGLITTLQDLARFVGGLWDGRLVGADGREEMMRWTPDISFPPESPLRYRCQGGVQRPVLARLGLKHAAVAKTVPLRLLLCNLRCPVA